MIARPNPAIDSVTVRSPLRARHGASSRTLGFTCERSPH
jgi:hypothetical protein